MRLKQIHGETILKYFLVTLVSDEGQYSNDLDDLEFENIVKFQYQSIIDLEPGQVINIRKGNLPAIDAFLTDDDKEDTVLTQVKRVYEIKAKLASHEKKMMNLDRAAEW